ncbi:ribonuclease domain-containing protein [Floccifex sp.]|uniref:ribonuclease domain-containing protein n=1 Tax=Floccifex sp. TaxID=2815810 RepID=UPI002A758421|nr:ribonuclease domain-containing protein [Floccifex sp.]MDD7281592.1 ribonuclease domain-containing protein [Erysipelotrichaceae bacterium]MDY2957484.1 ribonuclease domain-containing protein [Floccifex sp.]
MKKLLNIILCLFLFVGCTTTLDETETYSSKDDVALYIYTYSHLPDNYITKQEAMKEGWDASKGNLWDVCPGMSIGGDQFMNYEQTLPDDVYYECDIDYEGGYRNSKRLVYTEDGDVYYTEDHYETFELLYEGE